MMKTKIAIVATVLGLVSGLGANDASAFFGLTADTWTGKFVGKDFKAALEEAKKDDGEGARSIQGWSYFMLDDYGTSLATFRDMESEYPRSFDVNLGVAWNSIKLGRYADAEKYLERADDYAKQWQKFMVYDARGWLAMNKGDLDTAQDEFSMEDRVYGQYQDPAPDYSVSTGWLAIRRGDWKLAKSKFEGGINRKNTCYFCYDGLARVALQAQDYEEALKQTLKGIKITDNYNGFNGLLAASLTGINDPKRTVQTYKDLIKNNPDNATFVANLGYVYLGQGDTQKAEEKFRKALELEPGHPVAQAGIGGLQYSKTQLVANGWAAYYAGNYKLALDIFMEKASEAKAKHNPSAEDGRGWTLLALERPRDARDAFRAAIEMDPEFFYSSSGVVAAEKQLLVLYNQAWALTNLGRFDEALDTFKRSRAETPKDMQWLVDDGIAWISYYQADMKKADAAFKSIVKANDKAYLSKTGLGMVALTKRDFKTAASNLTASLVQNPYQALSTYMTPAKVFVDEGQYGQAKQILDLAEKIYPSSADIQFLYAQAAFGLKDDNFAAKKVNAAAYLAPTYIDPVFDTIATSSSLLKDGYLSLAWGLYYGAQSDKAVKRFDQYLLAGGDSASADTGRGWTLLALGKNDEAEKSFAKANDKGETADAYAGIGWARLGKDDISGAEKSFAKAQAIIPGYLSAQSGIASIQYRKTALVKDGWEAYYKGEYEQALKTFEGYLSSAKSKKNPAAEDGRGWTLLALGKNKEATKAFDAALKIDPSFTYSQSGRIAAERAALTLYNLAWAQSEAGLFDKAAANFKKARDEAKPEFMWLIDDGLAWIDFYKKDYDTAEKGFKAVLAKEPKAYLSKKGLGFVALKQGKFETAILHVAESVLLNPYQALATYTLPAEDLIKAGHFKQAKEILDLGFKIYPSSADINFQMAKVFMGLKDEKTAVLWANAAVALAPSYVDPVFDDLKLSAENAKTSLVSLAWGQYFARNNEQAIARFDEALKAGVNDPNLKRGKAFALFRMGKYKEAIPMLQAAAKLEPKTLLPIDEVVPIPGTDTSWTIRYSAASTLGWAYLRSGDSAKAEQQFKTILKDTPFWVDALTGYGYAQLEKKDKKGAKDSFTKVLGISPYYPDANQGLKLAEES